MHKLQEERERERKIEWGKEIDYFLAGRIVDYLSSFNLLKVFILKIATDWETWDSDTKFERLQEPLFKTKGYGRRNESLKKVGLGGVLMRVFFFFFFTRLHRHAIFVKVLIPIRLAGLWCPSDVLFFFASPTLRGPMFWI